MLSHLYADVAEEDGPSKGGGKKKGGSMQTISATHRVSSFSIRPMTLFNRCSVIFAGATA